jgi:hypothetical protein
MNVFYTNTFVPAGSAGCARGPFIFIRPEYRGDAGLLAHEKVHVRQACKGLFIVHALLYLLSDKYKLAAEVEAYKEQAKHYEDDRTPQFAVFISDDYGLSITAAEALKLLRS